MNYDTCKSTQQDEASYDNKVKTKIIPEGRGRGETRAMEVRARRQACNYAACLILWQYRGVSATCMCEQVYKLVHTFDKEEAERNTSHLLLHLRAQSTLPVHLLVFSVRLLAWHRICLIQ